jgi:hypothetical protein
VVAGKASMKLRRLTQNLPIADQVADEVFRSANELRLEFFQPGTSGRRRRCWEVASVAREPHVALMKRVLRPCLQPLGGTGRSQRPTVLSAVGA